VFIQRKYSTLLQNRNLKNKTPEKKPNNNNNNNNNNNKNWPLGGRVESKILLK